MPETLQGRVVKKPQGTAELSGRVVSKPESDGFMRGALDYATETAGGAYDWMTGDVPKEDLPEIGSLTDAETGDKLKLALGYLASTEPQQMADIAKNTLPDAKVREDDQGNPIVNYKGQDYYINRPGLSGADAATLTGEILAFLPSAKYASLAATLPRRIAREVFGSAVTSVAKDTAASALGSEQGVDWGRAGVTALAGGLFEGLTPAAKSAWRGIFKSGRYYDPKTGGLTKAGRRAAREAGLDPDDMSQRLSQEVERNLRDVPDHMKKTYGRVARAKEFDMPLSRGQATQNPKLLSREERYRHYGEKAGTVMGKFDESQRSAYEKGLQNFQEQVSGGQPTISSPQQAATPVTQGLRSRADALKESIDQAYQGFRQMDATLDANASRRFLPRAREVVKDFDVAGNDAMKQTRRVLSKIRQMSKQGRRAEQAGKPGPTLQRLDTMRRNIQSNIDAASNRADRRALIRLKNEFDSYLDDAFDNALFAGDQDALEALKNARGLRRELSEKFGRKSADDQVGKLLERLRDESITEREAINYIFGWGQLGNKKESARMAKRLKSALGSDSTEWNTLREGAWLKLVDDAANKARTPTQAKKAFDKAVTSNRELMESYFQPNEIDQMRRLVDTAAELTSKPSQLTNPSGTSYSSIRAFRDLIGRMGTALTFGGHHAAGGSMFLLKRMTPTERAAREARRLTSPLPRQRPRSPGMTATGTAATRQATETEDEGR